MTTSTAKTIVTTTLPFSELVGWSPEIRVPASEVTAVVTTGTVQLGKKTASYRVVELVHAGVVGLRTAQLLLDSGRWIASDDDRWFIASAFKSSKFVDLVFEVNDHMRDIGTPV